MSKSQKLKRKRVDRAADDENSPDTDTAPAMSAEELMHVLSKFESGDLKYEPDAKVKEHVAELANMEQEVTDNKATLYNLGCAIKKEKKKLNRIKQKVSEASQRGAGSNATLAAIQDPNLAQRIAELEAEVTRLSMDKTRLTAAVNALQRTNVEIQEAATKSEVDAQVRLQELKAQMMAVNQNQVKMRVQCDTLKRQKKDAVAKYQTLEAQVRAGGEVRLVVEQSSAPVVDVDAAVAAAVAAVEAKLAAQLSEKDAVIHQLRADATAVEALAATKIRVAHTEREELRIQNTSSLLLRDERIRQLEVQRQSDEQDRDQLAADAAKWEAECAKLVGKMKTLQEKIASVESSAAELQGQVNVLVANGAEAREKLVVSERVVASLQGAEAERDSALQRVAELVQQLAHAPSAEAVEELQKRQDTRAGLVTAAVAKLRVMFPSNLDWLAKKAIAHTPDMPQDKLDYFLLGSFGREAMEKLVPTPELFFLAQASAAPAARANAAASVSMAGQVTNGATGGDQEDGEVEDEKVEAAAPPSRDMIAADSHFVGVPHQQVYDAVPMAYGIERSGYQQNRAAAHTTQSCESSISTASAALQSSPADWSRPPEPVHPSQQWPQEPSQQPAWRSLVPSYPQEEPYHQPADVPYHPGWSTYPQEAHFQQDRGFHHQQEPSYPQEWLHQPESTAYQSGWPHAPPQPAGPPDWQDMLQHASYQQEGELVQQYQTLPLVPPPEPRFSRFEAPQPREQAVYDWSRQDPARSEAALVAVLRKLPSTSSLDAHAREDRAAVRPLYLPVEFTEVRITDVLTRTPEKRVRDLAERFGEIESFQAMPSKTAYHVKYKLAAAAEQAVHALHLYELDSKNITCRRYYKPVNLMASAIFASHPCMSAGDIELELRRYGDIDSVTAQNGGFVVVFFSEEHAVKAARELNCQFVSNGRLKCELIGYRAEDTVNTADKQDGYSLAKLVLADPITQKRSRASSPPRRVSNGRTRSEERDDDSRERCGNRRSARGDSRERGRPPPASPARGVVLSDPAISRGRNQRDRSRSRSPPAAASERSSQTASFRAAGAQKAVLADPALPATNRDTKNKKNGKFCSICQQLGRTIAARTHNDDEHGDRIPSCKAASNNKQSEDRAPVRGAGNRGDKDGSLSVSKIAEPLLEIVSNVTKPLTARR